MWREEEKLGKWSADLLQALDPVARLERSPQPLAAPLLDPALPLPELPLFYWERRALSRPRPELPLLPATENFPLSPYRPRSYVLTYM